MDLQVQLRLISRDDLAAMFEFQLDEDSNAMAVTFPRDHSSFMKLWDSTLANASVTARAIEYNSLLVGYISCFAVEEKINIGYWIERSHWGKGIASVAVSSILKVDVRRPVYAQAARSNAASIRVLEKCGFRVTEYKNEPSSDRYPACEVAHLRLY